MERVYQGRSTAGEKIMKEYTLRKFHVYSVAETLLVGAINFSLFAVGTVLLLFWRCFSLTSN